MFKWLKKLFIKNTITQEGNNNIAIQGSNNVVSTGDKPSLTKRPVRSTGPKARSSRSHEPTKNDVTLNNILIYNTFESDESSRSTISNSSSKSFDNSSYDSYSSSSSSSSSSSDSFSSSDW